MLFVIAANITAQETLKGEWKASVKENSTGKVHISFNGLSEGNKNNHQFGTSLKFDELDGITLAQTKGAKTNVNFRLSREAGIVQLTGTFEDGKGSGTWTFNSNPAFVSTMSSAGYSDLSAKDLFSATILNVKSQTARDLKSAGLSDLKFEDVIKATIFKIDGVYIKDMGNAGFKNLNMEDLVKSSIFKIDANYIKGVRAMGFGENSVEELVKLRIFKVTPEFLSEMKAVGLTNLKAEDVVQLRIFNIDSKFVNAAKAKGYKDPSVEELVELKIHGKVN